MRIIAFGDIHMNLGRFERIPGLAEADCLLILGDITNFGGPQQAAEIIAQIRAINPNILALAGNLDQPEVEEYLSRQAMSLHGKGVLLHGVGIFGVGGSNPTPFKTPTEFSEQKLGTVVNKGYEAINHAERLVMVSHTPPANTRTDIIESGAHVGSTAVRDFIERTQPDLCLCGHIHEARATDRIGATRIINPGMISQGGFVEVLLTDQGEVRAQLQTI